MPPLKGEGDRRPISREGGGGEVLSKERGASNAIEKSKYTGFCPENLKKAKQLRRNMTPQERRLWCSFLKSYPVHFYRQRPIDRYIVDFYCASAKLIVELDGSQHYTVDGMAYDGIRSDVLEQYGLSVLRFSNLDVDHNFKGVCLMIDQEVKSRVLFRETKGREEKIVPPE